MDDLKESKILAIGGGKGGIGKSLIAANLGVALAGRQKKVIIIDADLGGENLHLFFGIRYPKSTLADLLDKKVKTLGEISIPTCVENLRIIAGGADIINLANPYYQQKQKLIRHIKAIKADYILVDLGAGTSFNVVDFFNISNDGIVVVTPEPTAIQNAYLFLKNVVYRKLTRAFAGNHLISTAIASYGKEKENLYISGVIKKIKELDSESAAQAEDIISMIKPKIILNMFRKEKDIKFTEALKKVSDDFLGISLEFIGHLIYDIEIRQSVGNMIPFMFSGTIPRANSQMFTIADRLEHITQPYPAVLPARNNKTSDSLGIAKTKLLRGFNDNVEFEGNLFHVQTEVFLKDKPKVVTVVYNNGQILLSKKEEFAIDTGEQDSVLKQHITVIKGIKAGKLTRAAAAAT